MSGKKIISDVTDNTVVFHYLKLKTVWKTSLSSRIESTCGITPARCRCQRGQACVKGRSNYKKSWFC